MMKLKNEKGFTLIEVILSIALLSIVSGIVLQLFIASKNLNVESSDLDLAGIYAANAIEEMKAKDHWETSGVVSTVYYNEDWQQVSMDEPYDFRLILTMTENPEVHDGFFDITVEVTDKKGIKELVSYETSHYYYEKE